ncbi:MAG: carboxypeptidase-like regulatory domain-containing protein [Planctomycetes bacterium]|nr:carboxypeptidase-like regulatory domain-containing protein [Planctomycetota bacterium]
MTCNRRLAAAVLALAPSILAQSPEPLRGVVVERESGRGIGGARIYELRDSQATLFALRELAVTDARGAFELERAGSRATTGGTCLVRAPGRALGTFSADELPNAPTLGLEPAGTFVLQVRTNDALRRELRVLLDVERSLLDVQGASAPTLGRLSWNQGLVVADDVDAHSATRVASARFDELPLGVPLRLRVQALGEERRPDDDLVLIGADRLVERHFELTASVDVSGKLHRDRRRGEQTHAGFAGHEVWLTPYVRDGEARMIEAGASVSPVSPVSFISPIEPIQPMSTCTESDGRFLFDHVPPGVWVVATPPVEHLLANEPDSRALATPTSSVVVNFGVGAPVFATLTAERAGFLVAGRVVDPLGLPVAGATLSTADGLHGSAVTSGFDGAFVLGPLELPRATDDGLARLHVSASLRTKAWTRSAPIAIDGPVRGLELRLRRAARIGGRVVDEHGDPVAHAAVTSTPLGSDSLVHSRSVTTDADGRFDFAGVEPGACALLAHTVSFEHMAALGLDVLEGETLAGLVLTLRPSASVWLAPALLRTQHATVSLHVDGVCVAGPFSRSELVRGAKVPRRVPAGSVRVVRTRDDDVSTTPREELIAEFDLAPGETRTVVLPEAK